jgi:hypothetical protein
MGVVDAGECGDDPDGVGVTFIGAEASGESPLNGLGPESAEQPAAASSATVPAVKEARDIQKERVTPGS